ncbi:HIT domain-containing protein [Luminiphilus sp.]|nr:HIT domain-containing protein [Luminiphilus sp.]MDA9625466.1 HIT domain-containing protein [Luminiphilus sp.]
MHFITSDMRMSHIYQPVMLIELLRNRGTATTEEIARALLGRDRSQVEYYEHITKNMVGKVLTKSRGVTSRDKSADSYSLIGFESLASEEIAALIDTCEQSLVEFLDRRSDPWSHRRKSSGYIPGTLRYRILSKAKFRCTLCGVSAEHKALEVDHIVPRNKGGSDEESNLQALCYSCNAMKKDTDDADFREVADSYGHRETECLFCEIQKERVVAENELAYAILDAYPVTEQHTLVIPKRHVEDFFGLYQPERNAIQQLLEERREAILAQDSTVTGFNVGNNVGEDGGQTVMHCHTHLIPRRAGDMVDPKGGVRGVIPDRQKY